MKFRRKRWLFLLVALAAAILASGCSRREEERKSQELPVLNVMFASYGGSIPSDLQDVENALNVILAEKIGAAVKLNVFSSSSYDTQANLMLTGDSVDLMATSTNTSYAQCVTKGFFIEMDELLEQYGQGIKEALGEELLRCTRVNGKMYGVTGIPLVMAQDTSFAVRNDILACCGIDLSSVHTVEDVEQVLQTIRDNHPDIIPLANASTKLGYKSLQNLFLNSHGLEDLGDGCVLDYATMTVSSLYSHPVYEELAALIRDWHGKGLLMPNASTNTDSRNSLMNAGRAAASVAFSYNPANSMREDAMYNTTTIHLGNSPILVTGMMQLTCWGIPVTSEHPDKAMQFLNLLYTDAEIGNLLQYGIEGVHYEKTEEENVIRYPEGMDATTTGYFLKSPGITDINPECFVMEPLPSDIYEQVLAFRDTFAVSPIVGFTADMTACKSEVAAVANVMAQYVNPLLSGVVDVEQVLPEFRQKLKSAGHETIIRMKQEQLDKWLSENR